MVDYFVVDLIEAAKMVPNRHKKKNIQNCMDYLYMHNKYKKKNINDIIVN